MDEFEMTIRELDAKAGRLGNPNWVAISRESINTLPGIIKKEEELGYMQKGQTIIDMGSGNGSAAYILAHYGYKVIGLEIDTELYQLAILAKEKYPALKNLNVQFFNTSYYPKDYQESKKTKKLTQLYYHNYHSKLEQYICTSDTEHDIDLQNIDIFYAYAWSFQYPAIFEIFTKYARNDAKLITLGPHRDEVLSNYKKLERQSIQYESLTIMKKQHKQE